MTDIVCRYVFTRDLLPDIHCYGQIGNEKFNGLAECVNYGERILYRLFHVTNGLSCTKNGLVCCFEI